MDANLRYAYQCFLAVAETLATNEGDLRARILAAYEHFRSLRREDFEGELRERFIHLMKALTGSDGKRRYPVELSAEALEELLRQAPQARVAECAEYMFAFFLTLHRQHFTSGDEH